ncbi:phosphotransferase family protein [Mycolicibacterium litorale]|uniref:Aminoglycoside phosphotransferase n=1 Tax=Mycolicibacterium litorale TaxID=758802 RepID=A0AAD1MUV7_9MYCO|nr:phosphotransferase family protein [Mycolicibacterium litorale]MCV7415603.1 phosphotransferase family protein [Mycolicibacterium litorale]TDY08857.1 aminoglycoside phosphotransferase (APT) family kinase protein [Mycolicibacterium litorale]BBY16782.1 aminoglycoside phosphotransferase [Mycolicibacterium litorale]
MSDLDVEALSTRLATLGISDVQPLAGGASSLTFRASQGMRPVVVKVAPPGHDPVGHRDVLRQARIIEALAATDVPVPEVLGTDRGAPPEVPPLFVMSLAEGEAFEPLFDAAAAPHDSVPDRYRSAARVMAALHRVTPAELGLTGEPIGDACAEVDRWSATLQTVDPHLVPDWGRVRDALRASAPAPVRASVVHGDFRLGNLVARGARITAVIDWEIWSVGDPRVDAGWFLVNADPATYRRPSPYVEVVPPIAELAACYTDAVGAAVPDLRWFMALACFKSAATWSLIVKHNRRRSRPRAELEEMASALPGLLRRATDLLG